MLIKGRWRPKYLPGISVFTFSSGLEPNVNDGCWSTPHFSGEYVPGAKSIHAGATKNKTRHVLLKKMIKHAKICIPGISDLILSAGREPKVKAGW